jgi:hypothetical protein
MASKMPSCAKFSELMIDAASDALSAGDRAGFDAHVGECAACRDEFLRLQALLRTIDERVSASVAAEPSSGLIARVRQWIAEEPHRAPSWQPRRAWMVAAGACAALAMLFLTVRVLHRFDRPHIDNVPSPIASVTPKGSVPTLNPAPTVESARAVPPRRPLLLARHSSPRTLQRPGPEPQVIVEPGQTEAIVRFVAAARRGQIDGARLLADNKKAAEPLEIKPLTIVPLQIATLKDDSEPSASDGSRDDSKDFVSGRSN